ncbi:MAG: ATP-binding protein [Flexilinea sp.]|nr:ATP-binding protein [Flexilinea sp.]
MKLYIRETYLKKIRPFYHDCELIKVLTGIRRCGKSTILAMIKDELLAEGVRKEQLIDINLDKKGFKSIKTPDALENKIDELTCTDEKTYLFIDEIQNVDGFEEVINAFREEGNYSIFITGSNSYLLSGDLITKLTGRYLEFEIHTLDFGEYLGMKQLYQKPVNSNQMIEFNEYILNGGFPYAVQLDDVDAKRAYVENVVTEIIEKDIRKKAKVRHLSVFERIMTFVINNFGASINIRKIQKYFREQENTRINENTIARYIQIMENAKIIVRCSRFDMKSRKSLTGEQKYYLADLSLYFAQNTDNRINYGPVLENILFNYAKSRNYAVSVGRIGNLECDFIFRDNNMNYAYAQVAYTILASRETEDREYRSLEKIPDNYPKFVFTTDYLLQKRNGIKHENIMEFIKDNRRFE